MKLVDSDGGMLEPELDASVIDFVRMSGPPSAEKIAEWLVDFFGTPVYGMYLWQSFIRAGTRRNCCLVPHASTFDHINAPTSCKK